MIWIKGIPYKISFFLWSVYKKRIPTDDILRGMGIPIVSKCPCCDVATVENLNHLFLISPLAQMLWRHFVTCARFSLQGEQLIATIQDWWGFTESLRGKAILNANPAIVVWELWKRRNFIKHGKEVSFWKLLINC